MKTGDTIQLDGRRFEVVEQLGSGRTADVSLVRSGETEWVVKILRDPERAGINIDAFLAEASTLERLRSAEAASGGHPDDSRFPAVHVVDPDRGLLAMERAPGRPLAEVVGRTVLSVEQCLSVGRQLCEALGSAIDAEVYNPDLKLDSIFWDPRTDHLTVIDWNVARSWPPADRFERWLDPYTAMVGEVLDLLLLDLYGEGEYARPDWSRPPRYTPERWSDYLRIFQLTFMQMQSEPAEWSIEALHARLIQIEGALVGEPEALLRGVIDLLVDARDREEERARHLEEALAFAELAANLRNPGVIFRARELIGQAVDLLGDEIDALSTLRRAVRGEGREVHVRPGDSVEFHRLKRMAHAGHAVLGAADGLRKVMGAYEGLRWQTAGGHLDSLLQRFGSQSTLVEELTPLAKEAEGLTSCHLGLKHLHDASCFNVPDGTMHGFDPESVHAMQADRAQALERAASALESALSSWAEVPWRASLLVRFPEIESVAVDVRGEARALRARLSSRPAFERGLGPHRPPPTVDPDPETAKGPVELAVRSVEAPLEVPVDDAAPDRPESGLDSHDPSAEDDAGAGGGGRWSMLLLFLLAVALAVAVWVVWPFGPSDHTPAGPVDATPTPDSAPERITLSVGSRDVDPDAQVDAASTAALDAEVMDRAVDGGPPPDAAVDARKPRRRRVTRRTTRPVPKRRKDAYLEDLPPPVDAYVAPRADRGRPTVLPVDMNRPRPQPVDAGRPPRDAAPSSARDYNF